MTRQKQPIICDIDGKEISSAMKYSLQVNQTNTEKPSTKGSFVTSTTKLDICHACFLEICKNGYKPKWVKKVKDENTGKWSDQELDEQSKLD